MSILAVYDCMLFFMKAARPDRNRETFELVDRGLVTYCLSRDVLAEIHGVLMRPRHQRDFPELGLMNIDAFLNEITRRSKFIDPS